MYYRGIFPSFINTERLFQNQANVLLLKLSYAKILTAAFLEGNKKETGSIFCYLFSYNRS